MLNTSHKHFFAVCDGHGQFGKEASNFIKVRLPVTLSNELKTSKGQIEQSLKTSFTKCNKDLAKVQFDTQLSGSTVCTVFFDGNDVWTANAGDSRAILCSFSDEKGLEIKQITNDHKPDLEDEAARIKKKGGRIEAFKDWNGEPIGPMRVWVKHDDIPGLAMSRSMGDRIAHSVGVSAEAEV